MDEQTYQIVSEFSAYLRALTCGGIEHPQSILDALYRADRLMDEYENKGECL